MLTKDIKIPINAQKQHPAGRTKKQQENAKRVNHILSILSEIKSTGK